MKITKKLKSKLKAFPSQRKCATAIGIHHSTLSRIVRGKKPSYDSIIKIKAYFGLDYEELFK